MSRRDLDRPRAPQAEARADPGRCAVNRLPAYTDRCHGIVTRDGEQDACDKPATSLIDDPECGWWPACTWHANRYGTGRMVTLDEIVRAARGAS